MYPSFDRPAEPHASQSNRRAIGVYATSTAPTKKRDTFLGYMGAYGLSSTFGTGAASDGWTYSFTEPDPLSAVVQLNHPSTVSAPTRRAPPRP